MGVEQVLLKLAPVLLIIILGYAVKRKGLLTERAAGDISKLVLYVTLPALIFTTFLSIKLPIEHLVLPALFFGLCSIILAASMFVFRSEIFPKMSPLLLPSFEGGMFGYALFVMLFGQSELWKLIIFDVGNGVFFFFVIYALTRRVEGVKGENSIIEFIKLPVIISLFSGIALSLLGFGHDVESAFGGVVAGTLSMLGAASVPLIALSVGLRIRRPQNLGIVSKLVFAKFALCVPLGIAFMHVLSRYFGLDSVFSFAALFLLMLPVSFSFTIIMSEKNKDKGLAVNSILVSIPVSIALIVVSTIWLGL